MRLQEVNRNNHLGTETQAVPSPEDEQRRDAPAGERGCRGGSGGTVGRAARTVLQGAQLLCWK